MSAFFSKNRSLDGFRCGIICIMLNVFDLDNVFSKAKFLFQENASNGRIQFFKILATNHPFEMIVKKKKVQGDINMIRISLLFESFPDEIVLIILSYGTMDDIQSTRGWQSNDVQHYTETTSKLKAAENDNLDNIKWIYETIGNIKFYKPENIMEETLSCTEWAAKNGNLNMLKWLKEKKCSWNRSFREAAAYGNLENMKYLKENECPFQTPITFANVATGLPAQFRSHMMLIMSNNNCQTFAAAALHGNLENMIWLKGHECPWDASTFSSAVIHGDIENMNWLKGHECPWNLYTFRIAARYGNLEVMKWLKTNGCPLRACTFSSAAEYGDLGNMKWLLKNNCAWDEETFAHAAFFGNLGNLEWLQTNGCPIPDEFYVDEEIDETVIVWLEKNGVVILT